MAAYDSDLVMHPATDTDKAAVSSVSRNGLVHIIHCHHAEGCAEYKATADSDLMLHSIYEPSFGGLYK